MHPDLAQLLAHAGILVRTTALVNFKDILVLVEIGFLFFAVEYQDQRGILCLDPIQDLQEQVQIFIGLEMGTLQVQEKETAGPFGKHLYFFTDRRQVDAAQGTRQGYLHIVTMVFDLNVN
jgi:hypothetical protein